MLQDQFVLSRGGHVTPHDFVTYEVNGWVLSAGPQLPVIALGGRPGWLLGWPVEGARLVDGWDVPAGDVQTARYRLSGRWICFILDEEPTCYLDAGGTLAAVYSQERQMVASTTTLLNFADHETFVAERLDRHRIAPNQFLPAGLTSDAHALRLLPNHLLDLSTWSTRRHWPPAPLDRTGDPEEQVARIAGATRDVITALAARYPLSLPLTAGRDSRMVMAAARPVASQSTFVTFAYRDSRRTDATYAKVVSRRLGLTHIEVPLEPVDEQTRRAYLVRVGFDANEGKARDFDQGARRYVPLTHAWMTGFAGEIGRGYYWKDVDTESPMSAKVLLEKMHLVPDGPSTEAVSRWLADVPHQDAFELLDLAYLELRVGCWATPQMYGAAPFAANVVPMAQREVIAAMLRLPVDYRRQQRMAVDVVRANWPELADLPFGRPPGLAGLPARTKDLGRALRRRAKVRIHR